MRRLLAGPRPRGRRRVDMGFGEGARDALRHVGPEHGAAQPPHQPVGRRVDGRVAAATAAPPFIIPAIAGLSKSVSTQGCHTTSIAACTATLLFLLL